MIGPVYGHEKDSITEEQADLDQDFDSIENSSDS